MRDKWKRWDFYTETGSKDANIGIKQMLTCLLHGFGLGLTLDFYFLCENSCCFQMQNVYRYIILLLEFYTALTYCAKLKAILTEDKTT